MNISEFKLKLEPITGIPMHTMKLSLLSKADEFITTIDNDAALLGSYNVEDFMVVRVEDTNPFSRKGQYTDVSQVEKFEMTQEEYSKKQVLKRAFKERNKIGRFADVDPLQEQLKNEEFSQEASLIKVGDRCMIEVSADGLKKRGSVMYVGKTEFKAGYWIGVKYDEPLGKHNGTQAGKKYFECMDKYGAFVRPNKVVIGDYPELDFDDLDEL